MPARGRMPANESMAVVMALTGANAKKRNLSKPSAMSVVKRKWLEDESGAIGYVAGAALVNEAGLTEQVPAVLEIATNRETTRVREASPFGGWRKIRLRRPRATVTDDNVDALRFLDLVTQEQAAEGRAA